MVTMLVVVKLLVMVMLKVMVKMERVLRKLIQIGLLLLHVQAFLYYHCMTNLLLGEQM